MGERSRKSAKLPRHYWPIMAVALVWFFFLGAALGSVSGINPYIMGVFVSGAMLLREVYAVKRKGFLGVRDE